MLTSLADRACARFDRLMRRGLRHVLLGRGGGPQGDREAFERRLEALDRYTSPAVLAAWRESPAFAVALLAAFYGVMVAGLAVFIVAASTTRFLGPRAQRTLVVFAAAVLAALGAWQLFAGVRAIPGSGRRAVPGPVLRVGESVTPRRAARPLAPLDRRRGMMSV